MNIEQPFYADYLRQLSEVSGIEVSDFDSLCAALSNRLDYFAQNG